MQRKLSVLPNNKHNKKLNKKQPSLSLLKKLLLKKERHLLVNAKNQMINPSVQNSTYLQINVVSAKQNLEHVRKE